MEQTLFCSDCLQAMRNYSSDTGSPEARRRELPFWGIRQGKEVSIWAEFCVWRAALWQFFCNVERDAFEQNFKASVGTLPREACSAI